MRRIIDSAMISEEEEDSLGRCVLAFTGQLYGVGLEVADLLGGHE